MPLGQTLAVTFSSYLPHAFGTIFHIHISSFGWPFSLLKNGSWFLYGILLLDFLSFLLFWFIPLDEAHHFWPQDLKDFVRSAGEVTYADVDRNGRGYYLFLYIF